MRKGDAAIIKMQKSLRIGSVVDEKEYQCEVLQYNEKAESLFLVLKETNLTNISLDAFYECTIEGDEALYCEGQVKERYCDNEGAILRLQIKNGFYKINIKSVDKQKA